MPYKLQQLLVKQWFQFFSIWLFHLVYVTAQNIAQSMLFVYGLPKCLAGYLNLLMHEDMLANAWY